MAEGKVKWNSKKSNEINAKKAKIDDAMYRSSRRYGGLPNNGRSIALMLGTNSAKIEVDAAIYPKKIPAH